jgi:hypothetical protein
MTRILRGARVVPATTLLAAATLTGVLVAGSLGSAAHAPRVHLRADSPSGLVTYDAQGVTVAPPGTVTGATAPVAATAASVLDSFKHQGVPAGAIGTALDSATHTVAEQQVTEALPVSPEVVAGVPYPAWVVTYTGLPPVSYAAAPAPAGITCTFVGVMSRTTGDWTEFFSTCS